jgi:hypothetical protein
MDHLPALATSCRHTNMRGLIFFGNRPAKQFLPQFFFWILHFGEFYFSANLCIGHLIYECTDY